MQYKVFLGLILFLYIIFLYKVVQNNRVKSGKKPGREKGHKRSAPQVCSNPDKIVKVQKVATCTCGNKTIEMEEISRDLISIYLIPKSYCSMLNKSRVLGRVFLFIATFLLITECSS